MAAVHVPAAGDAAQPAEGAPAAVSADEIAATKKMFPKKFSGVGLYLQFSFPNRFRCVYCNRKITFHTNI